jgi:type III pantothenate kinase
LIITHKSAPNLSFSYKNPATLGADRIVNIIGGLARYQRNIIVVDCGTTVTLDIGVKPNRHLGGLIIPGMYAAMSSLTSHTALLKEVIIKRPRRLIGHSTQECMLSGIYYGTLLSIEQLIRAIKNVVKHRCISISTGGWGDLVAKECPSVDAYDATLTLYGILKLYEDHSTETF